MTKFRFIGNILLWGSAWGIFEATVGYLLHLLPISIGYLIWFPAAFFFMERCYRATNKAYSVILMAIFAASIKLLDLYLPVRVDNVVNPAISMVLESFAIAIVFAFAKNISRPYNAEKAFAASMLWRGLYLLYLLIVPQWMLDISVLADSGKLMSFLVIETFFNTLTIYAYLSIKRQAKELLAGNSLKVKPRFNNAVFAFVTVIMVVCDVATTILL